jgi:hypothetical protein
MAKNILEKPAQSLSEPVINEPKFKFMFQVVNPFLNYQKGALIISDDAIQAVIDNGDAVNCNRLPRS